MGKSISFSLLSLEVLPATVCTHRSPSPDCPLLSQVKYLLKGLMNFWRSPDPLAVRTIKEHHSRFLDTICVFSFFFLSFFFPIQDGTEHSSNISYFFSFLLSRHSLENYMKSRRLDCFWKHGCVTKIMFPLEKIYLKLQGGNQLSTPL